MMNFIKRIWARLFRKSKFKEHPSRRSKRREKEHYGAHYYMGDLLDRLDVVFKDLPRFRRLDPEAFDAYKKLGATVLSSDAFYAKDVEPSFYKNLPSFGCVYIGGDNTEEYLGLRFACFVKEARPVNVQLNNGTTYRVTMTYDFDGTPAADQFYVSVRDGSVRALKVCTPVRISVPYNSHKSITRMQWHHSPFLEAAAEKNDMTIDDIASEVFGVISNGTYSRESGLTVKVSKAKMSAVFAIDMLRTPYFFADREKVVNENGKTKPIIHIVKGHKRTLANGSTQFVKSHFRGLREFSWNGYDVNVTMAGTHGAALSSFNVASVDQVQAGKEETLSMSEVADRILKVT